MPSEDKTHTALPAQIEGEFLVEIEGPGFPFADARDASVSTDTLELFPQRDSIFMSLSASDETSISVRLAPRVALELAKKLMAMCAAYTEDIGACDLCDELFPVEELSGPELDYTFCTPCMDSGR